MVESDIASACRILDLEVDSCYSSRTLALLILHDLDYQHCLRHWTILIVGIIIDQSYLIQLETGHMIHCGSAERLYHASRPLLGTLARQLPEYHPLPSK